MLSPPSTIRVWPVTNEAAGEPRNITAAAISGGSPVFEGIADGDLDKAMRRVQANPIIYLRAGGKPISFNIGTYSTDDLARAKRYLRYENGHLIYLN